MSDKKTPDDREQDHSERMEEQEALLSSQPDELFMKYFDRYVEISEYDDDILRIENICDPKYRDPIARREAVAILMNDRQRVFEELDLLEAAEKANKSTKVPPDDPDGAPDTSCNNDITDGCQDATAPKQRKISISQRTRTYLGAFLKHLVVSYNLDPEQLPFSSVELINQYNSIHKKNISQKCIGGYIHRAKPTLIQILGCSEIAFSRNSYGGGEETIKSILKEYPYKTAE
ncbi:MAG: hypothetical protein HQM00_07450 [Magnetococcales bacterium]|nr:hypothetical protein [Magnetococcales bacterium]